MGIFSGDRQKKLFLFFLFATAAGWLAILRFYFFFRFFFTVSFPFVVLLSRGKWGDAGRSHGREIFRTRTGLEEGHTRLRHGRTHTGATEKKVTKNSYWYR